MTEAIIEGRGAITLVLERNEAGEFTKRDPSEFLTFLRQNERDLRKKVVWAGNSDVEVALDWCAAKEELLLLEGRREAARVVSQMGTEEMIRAFGPLQVVRHLDAALNAIREGK